MEIFCKIKSILVINLLAFSCTSLEKSSDCKLIQETSAGGFSYPLTEVADTAIFAFQLKDMLPTKDSLLHVYYASYFFEAFNEPNLSIKFQGKSMFRFIYHPWGSRGFVINMTCDEILVKTGIKGHPEPLQDESRMSELEREHLNILNLYFPINEQNFKPWGKKYFDSIITLHPQLLTGHYYRSLIEKSIVRDSLPFEYSVRRINLPPSKFNYFANEIERAGFWQLPYSVDCIPAPSDGGGYTFEANTPNKYKIVITNGCPIDTMRLTKVCQEIVNYAKLNKEIHLVEEE